MEQDTRCADGQQINPLHRACAVCGAQTGAVLGWLMYALFDDSPLTDKYPVVCCTTCGFVWCDTPATQDDYARFYEEYFYSPAYLARAILPEEQAYFAQTAEILASFQPDKQVSVVDIGCGVGELLTTLRAFGYTNLYGIDPSAACIDLITTTKGLPGGVGSMTHMPIGDTTAEIITLSHIVEHVIDLPDALRRVRHKLCAQGLVYVEVPDAARYDTFSPSPLRFFYLQHVIHFDAFHLDNLFLVHGYDKVGGGHRQREEGAFTMPCVWGMYQKSDAAPVSIAANFQLASRIKAWFTHSALDHTGVLANLARCGRPVYIWGIGIHTQMMLAMSPLRDCNIKYLVDGDDKIQQKTLHGKQIVSPEVLSEALEQDVVVIGALMHGHQMRQYLLEEIGFTGQVILL